MRKIICYIATSLDGYIARENHQLDWLPQEGEDIYGYGAFLQSIDTVVMGHNTYKEILSFDVDYPYPDQVNYVYSSTPKEDDDHAQFINAPATELIERLKNEPGKDIWLVGGGKLFSTFLEEGLIDELIQFIIPTTIGKGIQLFQESSKDINWDLLECQSYPDSSVKLHYKLK
jgi:dihydrofolate reductase